MAEKQRAVAEKLWDWFARHKRTLPWRDLAIENDTDRAYRILVSEVMLQQTQVPRVVVTFKRFLERFPTVGDLARVTNGEVILAWRGMGYNSRALRLRDAARRIVEEHGSVFPKELSELRAISGIGPYTAAAIRNFAFDLPTPCLDTNIRRILHRTFFGPEAADGTWPVGDERLLMIAEELLTVALQGEAIVRADGEGGTGEGTIPRTASQWHAALMDFGSLVQTKRNPRWDICPLTSARLMRATRRNVPTLTARRATSGAQRSEPGRMDGGRFIPNRIFRGRIVEALRDRPSGFTFDQLGRTVCLQYTAKTDRAWLTSLTKRLQQEGFLRLSRQRILPVH